MVFIEEEEESIQFAHDSEQVRIHIREAESGKNGYFCTQCGRELVARKGDINTHHFAHDAKDVKRLGKCTYSNEQERFRIAKDILQRIKMVKVPTLSKKPPMGIEGRSYKIRDAQMLMADTVHNDLDFYETPDGRIDYGRDFPNDFYAETDDAAVQRHFLLRAPVTFFDEAENPILLIELSSTSSIHEARWANIRRLGIDAIQIKIPKGEPQEIEHALYISTYTQWLYNYEQESTPYLLVSDSVADGIPESDGSSTTFEESIKCRRNRIKNLLRGLTKSLESESYRQAEERLRASLRSLSEDTARDSERLLELQRDHATTIASRFESEEAILRAEEEAIIAAEKRISREENETRAEERVIEEQYEDYKERIARIQKSYQSPRRAEIERIEQEFRRESIFASTLDEGKRKMDAEESQFKSEMVRRTTRMRDEFADRDLKMRNKYFHIEDDLRTKIEAIDRRRSDIETEFSAIESDKQRMASSVDEVTSKIDPSTLSDQATAQADFERIGAELRNRFEQLGKQVVHAVETRNLAGVSRHEFRQRITELLRVRTAIFDIAETRKNNAKLQFIKGQFESAAFKNWT
jgi:Competence protein CoiA-like family